MKTKIQTKEGYNTACNALKIILMNNEGVSDITEAIVNNLTEAIEQYENDHLTLDFLKETNNNFKSYKDKGNELLFTYSMNIEQLKVWEFEITDFVKDKIVKWLFKKDLITINYENREDNLEGKDLKVYINLDKIKEGGDGNKGFY